MSMDARFERRDGVLIGHVRGMLDAFGAGQLNDRIRESLHDDDRDLIIDLAGCQYLSSGGLRVFLACKKEMKHRHGRFILSSVMGYPKKVLAAEGFIQILEIFPSADAAREAIRRAREDQNPASGLLAEHVMENGTRITIKPGSRGKPSLHIIGDLDNVLYARITMRDIRPRRFSEIDYSLGLGALGASAKDAMPLLGEMITLHGSMVWLPTDGHNTPDFLTVQDAEGGDVVVYTGFAITLEGQFNEYITIECRGKPAISLTEVYRMVFALAKKRHPEYAGVVAIALLGITEGLASTGIKKSPVRSHAPADGASIMSPQHLADWIASDTSFSYAGDTIVSFGIGIDLTHDLSSFDPADISAMSYINPSNKGDKEMYLHNHGVVFRNLFYDPAHDLITRIRKTVSEGEFVDMRHLLDSTRISRATIGVAYIQSIRRES